MTQKGIDFSRPVTEARMSAKRDMRDSLARSAVVPDIAGRSPLRGEAPLIRATAPRLIRVRGEGGQKNDDIMHMPLDYD
jgi:hypothetical protein